MTAAAILRIMVGVALIGWVIFGSLAATFAEAVGI